MKLTHPRFLVISALCGGMGVLSGYAIFLTYLQIANAVPADHARFRFLLTLLITAVISYAIEWIRELIREGRIERAEHPIFRTMGTFVIVLLFELFILGFHTTSDLNLHDLSGAASQLLGSDAPASANWTLIIAGGLWIVVGSLLAAWLSRSVTDATGTVRHRIYLATRNGLIGGILFAPAVMALYIFAGRSLVALVNVYQQFGGSYSPASVDNPLPDLWHNIWLSQNTFFHGGFSSVLTFFVMVPLGLLDAAAQKNMALFMTCFLGMAVFAAAWPTLRKAKSLRHPALQILLGLVWLLCLGYTLVPFALAAFHVAAQLAHKEQLETLGFILLTAILLWAVPGALLGTLTPLLRRVATHTRNWAFVGYGSALLLIVATAWARAWWPLVPAAAAIAVGYMFQRGSRLSEYWPFAALCVAAGICGATSIAQHATFAGVVLDLHSIDMLQPAPAAQPTIAGRIFSIYQLTPTEKERIPDNPIGNLIPIRADNGQLILVAVRVLDAEDIRQARLFMEQHAAQFQALNDSLIETPPPAPPMPSAKDLPPRNPYIDAAIARMNNPDAAPAPVTKPRKTKAPPVTDDLPGLGLPDIFKPNNQSDSQETQAYQQTQAAPETQTTPAAATTPPPPTPISQPIPPPLTTKENTPTPLSKQDAAKALELSLSGSVGFWVTVGLLACWSMQENDETPTPSKSGAPS